MKNMILPVLALILYSCYYDNQEALYNKLSLDCNTSVVKYSPQW
jgi:hypothetical protein